MRYIAIIAFLFLSSVASASVVGSPPASKLATNLNNHTSAIGGTGWTTNPNLTVTLNTTDTTAPDGSSKATKMVPGAVSFCFTDQSVTLSANIKYALSVFVKKSTQDTILLGYSDNIANAAQTIFTFSTKTFTSSNAGSGTVISSGYYTYPNNWFRIFLVASFTSVPNTQSSFVYPVNSNGTTCSVGTVLYSWGVQSEANVYPTTYVAN